MALHFLAKPHQDFCSASWYSKISKWWSAMYSYYGYHWFIYFSIGIQNMYLFIRSSIHDFCFFYSLNLWLFDFTGPWLHGAIIAMIDRFRQGFIGPSNYLPKLKTNKPCWLNEPEGTQFWPVAPVRSAYLLVHLINTAHSILDDYNFFF